MLFEPPMPRNNYTSEIKYLKKKPVKNFEDLWRKAKYQTIGTLNGNRIYSLQRKKTWIHKHRYVKIRTSICGAWEVFTKENFDYKSPNIQIVTEESMFIDAKDLESRSKDNY